MLSKLTITDNWVLTFLASYNLASFLDVLLEKINLYSNSVQIFKGTTW